MMKPTGEFIHFPRKATFATRNKATDSNDWGTYMYNNDVNVHVANLESPILVSPNVTRSHGYPVVTVISCATIQGKKYARGGMSARKCNSVGDTHQTIAMSIPHMK